MATRHRLSHHAGALDRSCSSGPLPPQALTLSSLADCKRERLAWRSLSGSAGGMEVDVLYRMRRKRQCDDRQRAGVPKHPAPWAAQRHALKSAVSARSRRDRRPTAAAGSRCVPGPFREPLASPEGCAAPRAGTPDFRAEIERAWPILERINALSPGDFDAMRALLGELTG